MRRRLLPAAMLDLVAALAHGSADFDRSAVAKLNSRAATLTLEHNHIAGLFYLWLRDANCLDLMPADQVRFLKDFYVRQWLRMERLLVETGKLIDSFEERGIPVILLKGPHISQRFYGGIDQRAVADIDLLVESRTASAAFPVVEACGYRRRSLFPLGLGATCRFVHYIDFEKGDVPLDIHHSIRVHPTLQIDERRLWSSAPSLDIRGRGYRVLDDEHILLFQLLAIHSDIGRGYVRLRAFLDLLMIIRGVDSTIDWELFLAARARDRSLAICAAVLQLCLTLFNCRSRYPGLAGGLNGIPGPGSVPQQRDSCVRFLAESSRAALLLWWARQFDCPTVHTLSWWAVGLPLRYAACKSNLIPALVSSRRRP
jgi:hypothetical protein